MARLFETEGMLILKEDLNSFDFGVYDNKKITHKSITKYLTGVEKSITPSIELYIKNKDTGEEIKHSGKLYKNISDGIEDYYVDDFELGKHLFNWGGNNVKIKIRQIMGAEYEQENNTPT